MALMTPRRRKPLSGGLMAKEYSFGGDPVPTGTQMPPGTTGSDYVPAGILAGATNQYNTSNYANPVNPTYQPAANPYANKYITVNGQTMLNPNYYSAPFAGVPTLSQVQANPTQYGVTPADLTPPTATAPPAFPPPYTPPPTGTSPAPTQPPPNTTLPPPSTLPPSEGPTTPGGTQPPASGGGLPIDQPPNTTTPPPAGGSTIPTSGGQNTVPTSTPGAVPGITNNVAGTSGPTTQQRADDFYNYELWLSYLRDQQLGGGAGVGGNNIMSDGSYTQPDWLADGGLMAQWNQGANTNATTRDVDADQETVEGRLGRLMGRDNELNRIAMENAREEAAARGFIGGSSAAEGAALRASRQAMLPIAQQDAAWYGQTARDNMDALNRDLLSDQEARTGLIGQEAGIRANLYEAASDRAWRSKENNQAQMWRSMENNLSWLRQSTDREDQQDFAWMNREDEQHWNAWQSGLNRELERFMQDDAQMFQGSQAEQDRAQQRSMQYFQMAFGREGMLAETLTGIYSNPNLTPAQQSEAARNAGTFYRDLWASFNSTLALGIPEIFTRPYPMGSAPPGSTNPDPNAPAPGDAPTTPAQPPVPRDDEPLEQGQTWGPGSQSDPNSVMAPIISRNQAGIPTRATWGGFDQNGNPIWLSGPGGTRLRFDASGTVINAPPPAGPNPPP